jgi:hypothetical protein
MALWGNSDNVTSAGIVTVNYSTRVVEGHTTAFGLTGSAQVGDVIRFGIKDETNPDAVYFGDAVIASIASSESITIASTAGLSGAAIGGTDFQISELPGSSTLDMNYSEYDDAKHAGTSQVVATGTASTDSPVGFATIYLTEDLTAIAYPIRTDSDTVSYASSTTEFVISSLVDSTENDSASTVTLTTTMNVGVNTGDKITFTGVRGAYDTYVYGAAKQGIQAASGTQYEAGVGWVGVTTYLDAHNNLRVKKEILVAMSGITTGNTPIYDADPLS